MMHLPFEIMKKMHVEEWENMYDIHNDAERMKRKGKKCMLDEFFLDVYWCMHVNMWLYWNKIKQNKKLRMHVTMFKYMNGVGWIEKTKKYILDKLFPKYLLMCSIM